MRAASAVDEHGSTSRVGDVLAQEARALRDRLRVREHALDRRQGQVGAGDEVLGDGEHELADDRHVVVLVGERVERDADRALEGVLDRHDRAVDAAVGDGEDRVADRRQADELGVATGQRGARGLLRERAGGPEIAEPHQDFSAMRSASSSSGESLSSPLPSDTCLAYSRAWSR